MDGHQDDTDIEQQLDRLFDDARLDVVPWSGAADVVVRGAKRTRRRRQVAYAAGGSTLVAAALAGTLFAVTDQRPDGDNPNIALPTSTSERAEHGGSTLTPKPSWKNEPTTQRPATTTTTDARERPQQTSENGDEPDRPTATQRPERTTQPEERESEAAEPPEAPKREIATSTLGPDGYGPLKLGMSFEDAEPYLEEGANPPPRNDCRTYRLAEGDARVQSVRFDPSRGLVTFTASGARTPEQAGAGTSAKTLRDKYPKGDASGNAYRVELNTTSNNLYNFTLDGSAEQDSSKVTNYVLTFNEYFCGQGA